jgi:alpha-1,2-mannosyltransferase
LGGVSASGSRRSSGNTAGDLRYERAGILLWFAAWIAVSVMVSIDPTKRTVTPVFHEAVRRWWAGESLYSPGGSFHYLPQFALLFTPFHVLPVPVGDILWRLASVAACVYGLREATRRLHPATSGRVFFFASLLALAPCLGAVRNGQTNLIFGGVSLIAALSMADGRWWWAAAWLIALVAIKPLGLVLLVFAAVVYPRLRGRVLIAAVLFALTPFLLGRADFVAGQYREAWVHLSGLSVTTEHRFADIASLFQAAGIAISGAAWRPLRALAGGFTLFLALRAAALSDGIRRSLTLVLLAGLYLMLFNPMTEKNSYAILAPVLAVAAMDCVSSPQARRLGWWLVFVLISIGVLPEVFWRIDRDFGLWWDPLMMLTVYAAVTVRILRGQPVLPGAETGTTRFVGGDAPRY